MALKQRGSGEHIRVGDMTHRVKIYTITLADDDKGGKLPTGSDTYVTVWAKIVPLEATRALSYGFDLSSKPHIVEMIYEDGYIPNDGDKMEIKNTGQILYVKSVMNTDMKYQYAKILATEKK